jgi:hydroxypyruvate isomerase
MGINALVVRIVSSYDKRAKRMVVHSSGRKDTIMRVGMVSLGMGAYPLAQVLEAAQSAGCEALELNGRATVHKDLWKQPIDLVAIKAQLEASGVKPTSLGGYSHFAQLDDAALEAQVELFVGYCALARDVGIPIVRAFAGDISEGVTLDQLYPRIVAGFKAVARCVGDWGITVAIENHGRLINHGDHLQALLHDVDSPAIKITLDTGNFCWAGHSVDAAERFFDVLAPLAASVHVKDGRFVDGVWTLLPAGRGDIDLPGLMKKLTVLGYQGAVLSEYEGKADFGVSTLESVAYLRGLRDGLI